MAEKYRFFDAVQDENGQYDREYNAQEFTDYFKALVTTGIMKGAGNELAVAANGSNMITTVNTGIAFLLGRYYENDSPLTLTHDTETLGNSRIDRIIIRMDLSTEARYVKAFIKKGAPSTNPVAPSLVQTANLYEISLAQVKIVGGQTFIATNAVTDERGKDVVCPWAGSNILPNFNAEGLQGVIDSITRYVVTSGDDNGNYTATIEGISSYYEGMSLALKIHANNNSLIGPSININGLGKVNIVDQQGLKIPGNHLLKDSVYLVRYNGSVFMVDRFNATSSLTDDSHTTLATANAVKQVNDKLGEKLRSGSGSPEGVVTAPIGTLYLRTSGGTATTLYVKTSGTGNTGWTAK